MIHAATMVAAGVFLLGRTFPMLSPTVLQVVIATGAFTAIFAATIGCTVNDIKGVLAYSTISQLGFMVAAIGTGGLGLVAGLYHMATHAFFKACLFLSAGSVIHGCHHEQDMQKMGGLRKKMPITFACMLVCTLAISGMPLFSGFYSKDRIIASTIDSTLQSFRGANFFAIFALAGGAMLTTFYMFRLIFLTFFGEPRDHHVHDHAHESPKAMTISLVVLATFAVLGGHVWLTGSLNPHHTWFTHLVDWKTMYPGVDLGGMNQIVVNSHNEHTGHTLALIVSIGVLVLGFTGALWIYGLKRLDPARITGALGEVYVAVKNKYYVDEFVSATVIAGTMWLARAQTWIDENVVDGVVLGVGRVNKALGFVCAWIDKHIVDGAVNWVAHTCQAFGSVIRLFQTGRIQQYVSFAVGGAILVAAFHLLT
jgi:NADH-quinone oxidoreductase subunit L